MKTRKLSLFASATLMAVHSQGVVQLQDSYDAGSAGDASTDLGGGVFGYEISLDPTTEFSAAGHGKLVLVYSGWDNATADSTVTKVTYGGVELTEAVFSNDNGLRVTAGIYYLDNVVSDGSLRIELVEGGQGHFGFGLYALDGLKLGVQDTASARVDLADASVTMTTNSGFFVHQATRNNQSLAPDDEVDGEGGDDYQTLYNYNVNSFRSLSQYQLTTASGDYVAPINNDGGINFRTVSAAAFEADPQASIDPQITSITSLGSNVFELTLTGAAETDYEFYSSTTLEFTPGIQLENLSQGDAGDAGTIGGGSGGIFTTDASGEGKVRVTLTGPSDFVRAQTAPPEPDDA